MRAMVSLLPDSRVDTAVLKLAHPIAEVVARYGVELKRQGRAMVGRCIFHTDNGRPTCATAGGCRSVRLRPGAVAGESAPCPPEPPWSALPLARAGVLRSLWLRLLRQGDQPIQAQRPPSQLRLLSLPGHRRVS